jgi:outer membrane biogenesis lipoprotein LolB
LAVHERNIIRPGRPRVAAAPFLFVAIAYLSGCYPTRPSLSPLPPQVKSVEGYASLRLTREGTTVKSRFSFIFVLPGQGRIDVKDPLGRAVASLFIEENESYFVLLSKKMYWGAEREEAMAKFLGFALSPQEMTSILTGKLEDLDGWDVEKDDRNRVIRGQRDGLRFEVRQFFADSRLPRLIALSYAGANGSLRVLRLNFNQPPKKDAFRLAFLEDKDYTVATWDEIEQWLRHED